MTQQAQANEPYRQPPPSPALPKRVRIPRKGSMFWTTVLQILWWVSLFAGIYFTFQPHKIQQPLALALLAATFPLLLLFDLLHTWVSIDPKSGWIKAWRGHVIPWGYRKIHISELSCIDLDTKVERHTTKKPGSSDYNPTYTTTNVYVTTIALETKRQQRIVVERSSLESVLAEPFLALTRTLPHVQAFGVKPTMDVRKIWKYRFLRRGLPGILLIMGSLVIGGGFAVRAMKEIRFGEAMPFWIIGAEKATPFWIIGTLMCLWGFWLAITGSIFPSSLRRTVHPGEQSPIRFVTAFLSVFLCALSLLSIGGAAFATAFAHFQARQEVPRPGLAKLDKYGAAEIMKAWGFEGAEDCLPDYWEGCVAEWRRGRYHTTVYLVDLPARAAKEPSRVFHVSGDWMIEVSIEGAPKSEANALIAALRESIEPERVEAVLKKAGYEQVRVEELHRGDRDRRVVAERKTTSVKATVLIRDLSKFPKDSYRIAGNKFLYIVGTDDEEMLPILANAKKKK